MARVDLLMILLHLSMIISMSMCGLGLLLNKVVNHLSTSEPAFWALV
jgi:hypothetical protein